ncbi:hypothetical protein DW658_09690 [Dorea formicigenerans]|uniref:Uncharacterized protein n=1 Tax=Dorea formicigenerans TaxID=39486 RepID=A0A412KR61_9FIRM|nr:hypothetical protein DWX78_06630 [Dorea formicigenerans]RHF78124.1 hypothetical protein DW658_09690 [Dorea formicigenerans]
MTSFYCAPLQSCWRLMPSSIPISLNILPYDGTDYKRFLSVKSACTIIALWSTAISPAFST